MLNALAKKMAISMDSGRASLVALAQSGAVRAEDVERLRREFFAGRAPTRDEADAIFAIEASSAHKCAEWTSFFVETLTEYVVWQARPTGIVNESQGEWLIRKADGAASLNALALLVNVLAEAHRIPLWFVAAVRTRARIGWDGVDVAQLMNDVGLAEAA